MTPDEPGREPVARVPRRRLRPPRRRDARVALALLIVAVWAGSTVADIVSATYSPPEGLATIALAAATFLFSATFRRENRNDA